MGYARWDADDWSTYAAGTASKSRREIFASHTVPDELNPTKFDKRESRDSAANPNSNAIIIAADVTGSMGIIAEALVRGGISTTFEEILKRAGDGSGAMLTDPHLMVMGIGDVMYDRGPVQATQFEADIRIARQLEHVWLEGGGGGNNTESYDAAWYMAAQRTAIDCYEKRGKKGYLFTVGDECAPAGLSKAAIAQFFGDEVPSDLSAQQLLAMAEARYDVFHVVVEQGNYAQRNLALVQRTWQDLLGQRVLPLSDYTKIAEVIVSAIQVNEGMHASDIAKTWSGDTSLVVARAVAGLSPSGGAPGTTSGGIVRF